MFEINLIDESINRFFTSFFLVGGLGIIFFGLYLLFFTFLDQRKTCEKIGSAVYEILHTYNRHSVTLGVKDYKPFIIFNAFPLRLT